MGHFRHSTPTAGLEIIAAVTPLDVYIRGLATAAFRTKSWVELRGKPLRTPQTRQAHQFFWKESCKSMSLPDLPLDIIPTSFHWNKGFHVNMASFATGKPVDDLDTAVYTDGSGFDYHYDSGFVVLRAWQHRRTSRSEISWIACHGVPT